MALVLNGSALLNVASGVLMATLGGLVLLANPRKDWNRLFALLAVFWGVQIVSLNSVRLTTSEPLARVLGDLGLVFLIPLYFFIVTFADVFPRPRAPFGTSGLAVALLMLPAGLTLALLFAAPATLIADVRPLADGSYTFRWGPLNPYLVGVPFQGAFLYAVHVMSRRLDETESGIERRQIAFVLAALLLYVAYNTPFVLAQFGGAVLGVGAVREMDLREAAVTSLTMLVGIVVLARVGLRLRARLARARSGAERREARVALAALLAPFAVAVLVTGLRAADVTRVDLRGLLRSGSVALIVYAIARYQLFDIDLRVKRVAAAGTAVVAGAAVAAAAWLVLRQIAPAAVGGPVAALLAVAAFVPLLRVSSRLADRLAPQVSAEGHHLYLRKLEVYRAAVEGVVREGREAREDEPALAEMRAKLGLTEREHGVVVSLAVSGAEPQRAATPDLRPGGVAFGKYVIDSVLAEGGFGRVFLARDRILNRQVVVKELLAKWRGNAAVVKGFLREAQIAGQLNHPSIVAIHEVEQHGPDYYIVMEHLPGGSLSERLAASRKLPFEQALPIALALLDGLAAAHARGVVHRDVKPGNVLFGARGEVKLADFGIAALDEEDPQRTISGLTTRGPQPGTLAYMSPEQARGLPVDARSDVYAVGALLHRMLVGRGHVAVEGLDELEARHAVANASPPPPLAGVPKEASDAIRKALARDPAARFASAREFADALLRARGKAARAGDARSS